MGCNLKPTWVFVIACPQHFDFITLGLGFGLLMLAATALEPPLSNGLLV